MLDVTPNALVPDIKKGYYAASKIHHPDKPGGDKSRFEKIKYAYDVLTSQSQRKVYDKCGAEGLKLIKLTEPMVRDSMIEITFVVCCAHV